MSRVVLLFLMASATVLAAAPKPQPFRRPLLFEPNRGQAPAEVKWLARGPGYQLFFTNDGITMTVQNSVPSKPNAISPAASTFRMKLAGSHSWNDVTGLEPTGGISNYLHRKNSKDSYTNIPTYARLKIAGVYKGVDLFFYHKGQDLEYDFVVAPGADPNQIRMAFEGQSQLRMDNHSGDVILTMASGSELRQGRPKVYQDAGERRVEVAARYKLIDREHAAFDLAAYDHRRPLVIDPTVSFTRFLGGTDDDVAYGVAVDSEGNSYVTGETRSTDFPELYALHHYDDGCPDTSYFPPYGFCSRGADAFLAKLSPSGDILFATYLGGGIGRGVAVDSTGVYVTGSTDSPHFPDKIPGGGTAVRLGGSDLFVVKVSLNGITLIYSRIMSGKGDDFANAIALDSQQNIWVTGETTSRTFLVGAPFSYYYATVNGPSDVFYMKLGPTGNWMFTGLVGGSGADRGAGVAVDRDDNPWFTGQTCSPDFPASIGFNYLRGPCGVFVYALTNQTEIGTRKFGVVFGGSDDDSGTAIVVDANREAYVTGYTRNPLFPVRTGGYQTVPASTGAQAFVMKLDGFGHWIHSTFLGGNGETFGRAIALNAAQAVYVSGETTSSNFPGAVPLTPNPTAGFVSSFSTDLSTLTYTRLLGAQVNGVAVAPPALDYWPSISTAGWRYTGSNQDAFVVNLYDDFVESLTGTWIGTYYYGPDCGNYTGQETLVLNEANGSVTGSVSDKVISPSTGIFPGTVSGSRTGRTLSFTSVYDFGPRATFTGTIGKNGIEGKLTGVCVGGANVTFTKQ